MHPTTTDNVAKSTTSDNAPNMEKSNVLPNFALAMMPDDVEEIADSHKHGEYSAPAEPPTALHREK